jgi:hypothetical protein
MIATKVELVLIFFLLQICFMNCLNVLIMGDSLDRLFIQDWCRMKRDEGENILRDYEWGKNRSHPFEPYNKPSYWMCQTSKHSLAHSHFFGSRPAGPYYQNHRWYHHEDTTYVHTETRMDSTYSLYKNMFTWGHPDILLLSFATWDINQLIYYELESGMERGHVGQKNGIWWNKAINEYKINLENRIIQGKKLLKGTDGQVWLRTVPQNARLNIFIVIKLQ